MHKKKKRYGLKKKVLGEYTRQKMMYQNFFVNQSNIYIVNSVNGHSFDI